MLRRPHRFDAKIAERALALLLSMSPIPLFAQNFSDGWSPTIKTAKSGKWTSIHLPSIKIVGTPTSVVALSIVDPDIGGAVPMEFHCADERVNDRGIWRSIADDQPNSIRRIVFNTFCRFSHEGKRWRLIGGLENLETKQQTGIVLVDADNPTLVETPFAGVGVTFVQAGWTNEGVITVNGTGEIVFDCSDRSRSANKYANAAEFTPVNSALNTMLHSANIMFCSLPLTGKVPPTQRSATNTTEGKGGKSQDRSIGDASKTCSDLGFKKGTEKFGECVLKFSK